MNYKYDVSVLIVNYNGKKYIENLFESLCRLNHEGFTYEVIFEDNNSSDGSIEYLKSKGYDKKINLRIAESHANLGFAGGNNYAARMSDGKYLALLNNDTAVDENWLQALYDFMEQNENVVMANSKLLFFYDFIPVSFSTNDKVFLNRTIKINGQEYAIDNKFCENILCGEEQLTCFGHSKIYIPLVSKAEKYHFEFTLTQKGEENDKIIIGTHPFSLKQKINLPVEIDGQQVDLQKVSLIQNAGSGVNETYDGFDIGFCQVDEGQFEEIRELNNGCGASIIVRSEDFLRCGGFDERFFMYYEDTDLSYRLKKNGKKIVYCPSSLVRHIHTGSSKEWSPFFTYQVYRNKLLFIYKNISKKQFLKYFREHYRQGKNENNPYKMQACKDCVKIILGFKNVHFKG